MPRSKSSVKLSIDDLRRFIAGENGEIQDKLIEWAKGELARREKAGLAGGRTKGRVAASKKDDLVYDDGTDYGA